MNARIEHATCQALLVRPFNGKRPGEVCGEPAHYQHDGAAMCWLHYTTATMKIRTVEVERNFVGVKRVA